MRTVMSAQRALGALLLATVTAPFVVDAIQGDLTYYGGAGANGACSSSFNYPGFRTVALNRPQYANGAKCGACVKASWVERGKRKAFLAIVDNECPECKHGDLDYGTYGDGRWPVSWKFIKCPRHAPKFRTEGSNAWFGKLKVEGVGRVKSVKCGGKQWKLTHDGYWVGAPSGGKLLSCGIRCVIRAEQKRVIRRKLPGSLFGGGCSG